MPTEEHDSWLGNALGVAVATLRSAAQTVEDDAKAVVQKVEDGAKSVVQKVEDTASSIVAGAKTVANDAANAVKKGAAAVKTKALGDQSGKPVPRPLEPDCKPEHGQVPGPKNHLLCATHGHVIDTDQGMIIAESVASYVKQGLALVVKKVESAGNTAGKAVMSAGSAAWDDTKSAYHAVTGAYDAVAPNFTKANQDLGQLVDAGEAAAKKGNEKAAAEYADVPVLGTLVKASTSLNTAMIDAAGGVVKGVGDLATMAGNAVVHPIDATVSLGEGALGIAEHVPIVPGLNTTVKGVHGLVDLARGKKDGEYGGSLADLGENLLLDTKQDPNDPSKRTNADIDFLAGMGGGTKVWSEKPVEAATRTITNLAPMAFGDEGGGAKPAPEGPPVPEGGPPAPKPVDPFAKTQVDPLGKTDPQMPAQGTKTDVDPKTEVDPQRPARDPDAPKGNPEEAFQKARRDLVDAAAEQKAAEKADIEATQEWIRYRQNMPDPANGRPGDPSKWDPVVDAALEDQANRAAQAHVEAINNMKAAQRALRDADAAKARAARGRGGST